MAFATPSASPAPRDSSLQRGRLFVARHGQKHAVVTRDTKAIAAFAIRVAGAGDEADFFRRVVIARNEITRRDRDLSRVLCVSVLEQNAMSRTAAHLVGGDNAIFEVCAFADRHHFEQTRNEASSP